MKAIKLHLYFKGGSDFVIPVQDWSATRDGETITKLTWTHVNGKATMKFVDVTEILAIIEEN